MTPLSLTSPIWGPLSTCGIVYVSKDNARVQHNVLLCAMQAVCHLSSLQNFLVISNGNLTQTQPENLHSLCYSHPANLCAVEIIAA